MSVVAEFGEFKLVQSEAKTFHRDGTPLAEGDTYVEVQKGDEAWKSPYVFPAAPITSSPGNILDVKHEEWMQKEVKYAPRDIIITTFAKCGTTYMEQIVLLLLNNGDLDRLDPLSKNCYNVSKIGVGKVWPEACLIPNDFEGPRPPGRPPVDESVGMTLEKYQNMDSRRVIKTHANVNNLLSKDPETGAPGPAKYIFVTRNPFDTCVSNYYFSFNPAKQGWPFEAWALAWLEGYSMPCCGEFFQWHKDWKDLADKYPPKDGGSPTTPEIMWTHYEDILASPKEYIEKVAKFLGIEATPELIQKVADGSDFNKMKQKALEDKTKGERSMDGGHIRKGGAGGWKKYFTPELEALFRQRYKDILSESGVKFTLGEDETLE